MYDKVAALYIDLLGACRLLACLGGHTIAISSGWTQKKRILARRVLLYPPVAWSGHSIACSVCSVSLDLVEDDGRKVCAFLCLLDDRTHDVSILLLLLYLYPHLLAFSQLSFWFLLGTRVGHNRLETTQPLPSPDSTRRPMSRWRILQAMRRGYPVVRDGDEHPVPTAPPTTRR